MNPSKQFESGAAGGGIGADAGFNPDAAKQGLRTQDLEKAAGLTPEEADIAVNESIAARDQRDLEKQTAAQAEVDAATNAEQKKPEPGTLMPDESPDMEGREIGVGAGTEILGPERTKWETVKDTLKAFGDAVAESRIGKWVAAKWESLKTVAGNWRETMIDMIKLKTEDKHKFLQEKGGNNIAINLKKEDIKNLDALSEFNRGEITRLAGEKIVEDGKFAKALESVSDPVLVSVFTKGREGKMTDFDKRTSDLELTIDRNGELKLQYEQDIHTFEKNIEDAGSEYEQKIDGAIDRLKERSGYEARNEEIGNLTEQIKSTQEDADACAEKIADYERAMEHASILGKEDQRMLKERLTLLKSEHQQTMKTIERAEKLKDKLKSKNDKVDKKIAKFNAIKAKYGLGKAKDAVPEVAQENAAEENGEVVAETGPEAGAADAEEAAVAVEAGADDATSDGSKEGEGGEGDTEESSGDKKEGIEDDGDKEKSKEEDNDREKKEAMENREKVLKELSKKAEKLIDKVSGNEKPAKIIEALTDLAAFLEDQDDILKPVFGEKVKEAADTAKQIRGTFNKSSKNAAAVKVLKKSVIKDLGIGYFMLEAQKQEQIAADAAAA